MGRVAGSNEEDARALVGVCVDGIDPGLDGHEANIVALDPTLSKWVSQRLAATVPIAVISSVRGAFSCSSRSSSLRVKSVPTPRIMPSSANVLTIPPLITSLSEYWRQSSVDDLAERAPPSVGNWTALRMVAADATQGALSHTSSAAWEQASRP